MSTKQNICALFEKENYFVGGYTDSKTTQSVRALLETFAKDTARQPKIGISASTGDYLGHVELTHEEFIQIVELKKNGVYDYGQ